jgi:flavin reductase (DIM6/NTAB) family NADH-FMN oxidoreductase RutF
MPLAPPARPGNRPDQLDAQSLCREGPAARKAGSEAAGFSRIGSELVRPERAKECPFQLEALGPPLDGCRKLKELGGGRVAIVEIIRVHADETYLQVDSDHIDPAKWSPLLYNFRHYYELSQRELGTTFRA